MKNRLVILLVFFPLQLLMSQNLDVIVDDNRFLDKSGNTILEINYQVDYAQLSFAKIKQGFVAKLSVDLNIDRDGESIYAEEFIKEIVLQNKDLIDSDRAFYDKFTLTLAKNDYDIKVLFNDIFSGHAKEWSYQFEKLPENTLLSDIEFSVGLREDGAQENTIFRRGDIVYDINPDHIFEKQQDHLVLYYEIQNFTAETNIFSKRTKILKEDSLLFTEEVELLKENPTIARFEKIDISDFPDGYFTLEITVKDLYRTQTRKDYFAIVTPKEERTTVFEDVEQEFRLLKYFLSTSQEKVWDNLSEKGKKNFIEKFWKVNNAKVDGQTTFRDLILQRVEYANQNFSSFKQGWETDMGRIFIKYGKPDDMISEETGLYTKLGQKDYQIWKYRSKHNLTYIFLDFKNDGSYKIIYSENDESEITDPNWKQYLGKDFDEGLLY